MSGEYLQPNQTQDAKTDLAIDVKFNSKYLHKLRRICPDDRQGPASSHSVTWTLLRSYDLVELRDVHAGKNVELELLIQGIDDRWQQKVQEK